MTELSNLPTVDVGRCAGENMVQILRGKSGGTKTIGLEGHFSRQEELENLDGMETNGSVERFSPSITR